MENIILLFFLAFAVILFGILLEKARFNSYNLAECTRQFKTDVNTILHVLCSKETVHHTFDASLEEELLKILADYHHTAFLPTMQVSFLNEVPTLQLTFVPARDFERKELMRLCHLVRLKFLQYCMVNGLKWRCFTEFHILNDGMLINVFYCEFKEDEAPFKKRYRSSVQQSVSSDFGVLRDKDLESDLKNV